LSQVHDLFPILKRAAIVLAAASILAAAPPRISLEQIASGLARPVSVAHAGDGSGRLFIVEQRGAIRVFDGGQLLPTPFLAIQSLVRFGGERGLLGLAFDPSYATNGFFYVNYTRASDAATTIARYQVSANNPNIADPSSAVVLLNIQQPNSNHNGGQIAFGPDGYLYIGTGDGGGAGDPDENGQDLTTLLGKILRIDVSNAPPYATPLDNPFVGNPAARDEIWAYGLRNPWRFSFDRDTGDLFIGDVGQNSLEEIDFQPAASSGGENYGWDHMEGSSCFDPPTNCNDGSLTLPVLEYSHSQGCSVTGGFRYRGSKHLELQGRYIYGDFCSGNVWAAQEDGANWIAGDPFDSNRSISAFGEDEAGELYLVDVNGGLFRLLGRCTLDLTLESDGETLTWTTEVGTLDPGWLFLFGAPGGSAGPFFSQPTDVIDPPQQFVSVTAPFPGLDGVLAVLWTPKNGSVCFDFEPTP